MDEKEEKREFDVKIEEKGEETAAPAPARRMSGISGGDLERLLSYIDQIEYGSVTVLIQDGRVIQIDRNEKIRLK
jgi:hypothetical protein